MALLRSFSYMNNYHFGLCDNNGNSHFYNMQSVDAETAEKEARKHFKSKFGTEATQVQFGLAGEPCYTNID